MKYILLALLFVQTLSAAGRTFEQVTAALPLGTSKEDLLKAEPTGRVVPAMATPRDVAALKESVIVMEVAQGNRLICQFYLINNRVAAMMMTRAFMPGTSSAGNRRELDYVSSKEKLSEFTALRAGSKLEPLDVKVERYGLGKPDQSALVVSSPVGPELWMIDETAFDAKSFFMAPTAENREKLLKSKQMIDEKMKGLKGIK
jgi:hypothetical protein